MSAIFINHQDPDVASSMGEIMGRMTVEAAVRELSDREPNEIGNPIRFEAVLASNTLQLPTPRIELEEGDEDSAEESTQFDSTDFGAA